MEDAIDNCLAIYNPDQADTDGNGMGDACDPTNNAESILILSKTTYAVNENIVVQYANLPGNSTDLVSILEAGASNANGARNGTMTFNGCPQATTKPACSLKILTPLSTRLHLPLDLGDLPRNPGPSTPFNPIQTTMDPMGSVWPTWIKMDSPMF